MIIIILLIVSFALFFLAFVFILFDILKVKNKEGSKKEGISKLSGYSYGLGLLALLVLMFIGAILSI